MSLRRPTLTNWKDYFPLRSTSCLSKEINLRIRHSGSIMCKGSINTYFRGMIPVEECRINFTTHDNSTSDTQLYYYPISFRIIIMPFRLPTIKPGTIFSESIRSSNWW